MLTITRKILSLFSAATAMLTMTGAAWATIFTPPELFPTAPYVYASVSTPGESGQQLRTNGFASVTFLSPCNPFVQICAGTGEDSDGQAIAMFNHLGAEASVAGGPGIAGGDARGIAWSVDLAEFDYKGTTDAYLGMRARMDGYAEGFGGGFLYLALEPWGIEPYTCAVHTIDWGDAQESCTASMLIHPGVNQFQIQLRLEAAASGDNDGGGYADFSHTAFIDSVFLMDMNGNEIAPITIQGDSGTVYGASSVPEPSSLFLIPCGIVGLGALRRARRGKR